jgi:metal-responsive CopG/Arc/MetJ family transcriptional regulator
MEGKNFLMSSILVDLKDEIKAALDDAAREEGLSQNELIDKALQDYLFIRRFRNLRARMMSQAGKAFSDQEVFDLIS